MMLHLASTRTGANLAAALSFLVLAIVARRVPVPAGGRLDFIVPAGILLPLLAAILVVACTISPVGDRVRLGVGHAGRRDLGVLLTSTAGMTAILSATAVVHPADGSLVSAMVRNLVVLTCLGATSLRIVGPLVFWAPPVAYVLVSMVAGRLASGHTRPWAFIIDARWQPTDLPVLAVGVVVLVAIGACSRTGLSRNFC